MKQVFQILSVDEFIARMPQAAREGLTEKEQRIVAKTAINIGIEYNQSGPKAVTYVKNLNELQRTTMKKYFTFMPEEMRALGRHLGIAD